MVNEKYKVERMGVLGRLIDTTSGQQVDDIEKIAADFNELEAYRQSLLIQNAAEWQVEVYNGDGTDRHVVTGPGLHFDLRDNPATARQLAMMLNELEACREERRWRKIGEEWPEDGQECDLKDKNRKILRGFCLTDGGGTWLQVPDEKFWFGLRDVTHWRPAPTDVPKEEG